MPSTTSPPGIHTGTAREQRFRDLFADVHDDVLRFAQRRVHPSQAEDVVADAFLIAWRRFDEAPSRLPDQRAWVYGITRNCLLNTRRGIERQGALAIRLADLGPATGLFDGEEVAARVDLARAWRALPAGDQEVLALSAFEGLTSPGASRVLGITSAAYRLRLMRARRALRAAFDAPAPLTTLIPEAHHDHA